MNDANHDEERRNEIDRLRKAVDAERQENQRLRMQLDRAGANFEEFVSLAAHNLRESLRDVVSFGEILAEEYRGRLDSTADLYLTRIQAGAGTMQSLLVDVVNYWAIDTGRQPPSRTEMEAVLRQALLSTERDIEEKNATVTHDPLPAVMGDSEALTRVLQHLIGNAMRFCGASPRIHISAERQDIGSWVFAVRDNGPGIDPAFHNRIFGVFRRLHGKEYPGNGLGLAFCKKVIEGHGGRIWIDSKDGGGATFYFTLPSAD